MRKITCPSGSNGVHFSQPADRGIPRENVGGVHPGNAVPDGPGCIYGAFRCSGGDRLPDGADPIPGDSEDL